MVSVDTGTGAAGRMRTLLVVAAAALGLGACAQGGAGTLASLGDLGAAPSPAKSQPPGTAPKTELQKAVEYWGDQFQKKPQDPKAALNFAKNLKAAGYIPHAMQVLAQGHTLHPRDREIASEYGRLALTVDKVAMAETLLAFADDPTAPDWRVLSGRGTVHAKRGEYDKAVAFYEKAMALAPNEASVQNNLALAYAANGESQRAETLLRTASAKGDSSKIRQNLALVVGLQGRYGEAQLLAAKDLSPEQAASNANYVRQMVRTPDKSNTTQPTVTTASVPVGKPSKAMLAVQRLADGNAPK